MASFNKREKVLSLIVGIEALLIIFLLFKIVDYKINLFVLGGDRYVDPHSMEDSIEDASMIFLCKPSVTENVATYKIEEIIYKDEKYEFPYKLGDVFPRLQETLQSGYSGDGMLVILSSKPPTTFQSLRIMSGAIPGLNGISLDDFIKEVNKIKKLTKH